MKRTILIAAMLIAFKSSYAQFTSSSGNTTTNDKVGIGTTTPITGLHIVGPGTNMNGGNNASALNGGLIIQGNTGTRSTTAGPQLEFVIPANIDGTNPWGQARIITVAGNTSTSNATGSMILGTRRYFNKLGTGNEWFYGDDLTVDGSGNVGVGAASTGEKLEVKGNVRLAGSGWYQAGVANWFGSANNLINGTAAASDLGLRTDGNLIFMKSGGNEHSRFDTNGNLGLGTTDTKGYKLAVNGSMIATSIKVKSYTNWPDYVFKPTYALLPLSEVKAYIDQNQHLPEVPAAAEVEKNGQDLGEMNKILLKKVEELTLYLIQLKEENETLKKKQDECIARIEALQEHE